MATKVIMQDPLLNEFVFDVIVHSDLKERAKLSDRQRRNFKSALRTKHYVSTTTLDEKLILLAKLGVSYSVVIHRVKTLFPAQVKKMFKQHKKELTEDTVSEVLKSGVFVLTDKKVVQFLNLMDSACHSDSYMLNRDFYNIGKTLGKWKDISYPTNENIKEGFEYMKLINKFLLSASSQFKDVQGVTKTADLDLRVLLFLFDRKDNYVPREIMNHFFKSHYKLTLLSAAIKRLFVSAHIERMPNTEKVSYMITGTGIDIVLSFMRKVMTDTLEY